MDSLGTLLMALSGLSTRTVLTAEKLTFCRLREYSSILQPRERKKEQRKTSEKNKKTAASSGKKNTANVRVIICSQLRAACTTCSSSEEW